MISPVDLDLTFLQGLTHPIGGQTRHLNFIADKTGFEWVAEGSCQQEKKLELNTYSSMAVITFSRKVLSRKGFCASQAYREVWAVFRAGLQRQDFKSPETPPSLWFAPAWFLTFLALTDSKPPLSAVLHCLLLLGFPRGAGVWCILPFATEVDVWACLEGLASLPTQDMAIAQCWLYTHHR